MDSMTREELIDKSEFRRYFYKGPVKIHANERRVLLLGIWNRIRRYCGVTSLNSMQKNRRYKYYGGRGIKVCDEWTKSYKAFRRWALLNGYRRGLSIDRIDRDGDYEPANCQWITVSENSRKANYYRWHVKPFEVFCVFRGYSTRGASAVDLV